jgi:hypothetical protein
MTQTAESLPAPVVSFTPVNFGDHFRITASGLDVIGDPDFDTCHALWESLRSLERGIQFAIGDAAKYIREHFGERADQIITAATGWSHETVRAYEWTAEKVPPDVRHMEQLTYSHHQAVGKLPPREQSKWLGKAAEGEWSVAKMKSAMKQEDAVEVNYWLQVKCKSEQDRENLQKRLESQGYITALRGA